MIDEASITTEKKNMSGSTFFYHADSLADARNIVEADPYFTDGVVSLFTPVPVMFTLTIPKVGFGEARHHAIPPCGADVKAHKLVDDPARSICTQHRVNDVTVILQAI
jgi:hypothetical protein